MSTPDDPQECHVHEGVTDEQRKDIREKVCSILPAVYELGVARYCLLHFPSQSKSKEFDDHAWKALGRTEGDCRAVFFPATLRYGLMRRVSNWNFSHATFSGPTCFSKKGLDVEVNFSHATFRDSVRFEQLAFLAGVEFRGTAFLGKAVFDRVQFEGDVRFDGAIFADESDVSFNQATVKRGGISFNFANIKGSLHFEGGWRVSSSSRTDCSLLFIHWGSFDFESVRIARPERISFRNLVLRPSLFVGVDVSKFVFTNCEWLNVSTGLRGNKIVYETSELTATDKIVYETSELTATDEIEELIQRHNSWHTHLETVNQQLKRIGPVADYSRDFHALFERVCWQLADNYEAGKSYEQASKFRTLANESMRQTGVGDFRLWKIGKRFNGFKPWRLHWWYWLSSFYGESVRWSLIVLLVIVLGFAWLYTYTDFQVCPPVEPPVQPVCSIRKLTTTEAIRHSFAIAALQPAEYRKPTAGWAETLVVAERILAPLQFGLVALAFRRRFMR